MSRHSHLSNNGSYPALGGTSKDDNLQMLCLMCYREKDELGGMYKMTEESMVCGMSVFEKKVLKRFRINPSRRYVVQPCLCA